MPKMHMSMPIIINNHSTMIRRSIVIYCHKGESIMRYLYLGYHLLFSIIKCATSFVEVQIVDFLCKLPNTQQILVNIQIIKHIANIVARTILQLDVNFSFSKNCQYFPFRLEMKKKCALLFQSIVIPINQNNR